MKHVYTSIDIGSDTIKIVVCELFHNKLNLLAASSVKAKGIKKGLITDVKLASESIKKGIKEVEQMLGIKITKVITSIPSYSVDYAIGSSNMDVGGQVTGDIVNELMKKSVDGKIVADKELVTIIPIDFELDDKRGIKDPKGMDCQNLSVRTIIVSIPKKGIYSVISLLENIGLEVVDVSLDGIGDYYSFKSKENATKVGAIVNIGYETTSISLYNKGIIFKSSILGLGGKNIDNDISYIYKVSSDDAIKLKEKFALAHNKYANVNDSYEITNRNGEIIKVNQQELSEIVMSRIEEILVLARKEINTLTKSEVNYIIITGGTSSMNSFSIASEEILGSKSSVGNIKILGVRNNKYSSAIGNVVYFINKLKLKGKDYTMISEDDMEDLSANHKGLLNNISNDSMLGKVFGYFFTD